MYHNYCLNQIIILFVLLIAVISNRPAPGPSIPLKNAADPTLRMPVIGLGTGGYNAARSSEAKPEHWNATEGFLNTLSWFNIGGVRWDTANTYQSQPGVAAGLLNVTNNWSTTSREDIFITSKVGPGKNLGYNDTLKQIEDILKLFNTKYVDLLLIHWPAYGIQNSTYSNNSTDPYCNANNKEYDPTLCRQSTWKAMELIFNRGQARAIGTSNFEKKHLMDIFNLNSLIPAVNMFEFHGYWKEFDLVEYCQSYDISVTGYSPVGAPDVEYGYWPILLTQHPVAMSIGNKYHKTAAQTWLRWMIQQNIATQPRSWNVSHQQDNLNIFDFELDEEDMLDLSSVQPPQGKDPKVCPNPQLYP